MMLRLQQTPQQRQRQQQLLTVSTTTATAATTRRLFLLLVFGCSLLLSPAAAAARLWGVNYDIRDGPDWLGVDNGRCKPFDRVVAELQQLHDAVTNRVRVYSVNDCDTAHTVLQAAEQVDGDLSVWLGLWASDDPAVFEGERARFLELLATVSVDRVIGVHVTSEAIYREEITVTQAIEMRDTIKADLVSAGLTNIPVTVADIIDTNLANPVLIGVDDDVATFNQFPFWETTTNINDAAEYMGARVTLLENQAGGRQIIVTETGWADGGANDAANPAHPAAMQKWLRDFVCLAESRGWQYFWFNAFDNDWRRVNEQIPDDVEGHFGLFDEEGNLKPHMASILDSIDCSQPPYNIDPNTSTVPPAVEAVSEPTVAPNMESPPVVEDPVPTANNDGMEIPMSTIEPERNDTSAAPATDPTAAPAAAMENDPTAAPSNATGTIASPPTAFPPVNPTPSTASPVDTSTAAPTLGPVETVAPSASPSVVVDDDETATPSLRPSQSLARTPPSSSNNSNETSSSANNNATAAPTGDLPPELCSANSDCPVLPGTEACCPTKSGLTLACCEGSGGVVAACSGNPQCDFLGIGGFCCPTDDDRYLDCCDVLPDECLYSDSDGDSDGACNIYNAVRYKLELDQAKEAESSFAAPSLFSVLVTSSLGVAMLLM